MAIQDDFTIDYVDRKITYTNGFAVGDKQTGGATIANTRYTVNALYSFLQDTFDEPDQMDDPVPMSAQTPTQYTLINKWFIDNETMKALYSGSIQTSGWTYASSEGITQLLWDTASDAPDQANIGTEVTGGTSGATGIVLAVDETLKILTVRNNNGFQFAGTEAVTGTSLAITNLFTDAGAQQSVRSGESVWANLFSVGTVQNDTEIYVAQEDENHGGSTVPILSKLASWWDSDTDFTASTNGVAAGHFDVLVKAQDAGVWIDDLNLTSQSRLAIYARQGRTVYSHFETLGSVGNFVVPFASTGFDINQRGFEQMATAADHSAPFTIGEVITGAVSGKALVTAFVDDVSIDYIFVGKDQSAFGDTDVITGESSGSTATRTTGAATAINGAVAGGVTVTVGHNETFDVDEDGSVENYSIVVDCNTQALSDVYEHLQFLTRRGSVSGILPEPGAGDEDGEFYRGVGDVYITVSAEGTALTEGQTVTGGTSSATGELTAYRTTAGSRYVIITNVKGTFVGETLTDEGAGSVTIDAGPETLVDVSAAPFGTFAGGRFFVARAVVLDNVPAADNNNWQTSDVTGTAFQPPTTILVTFDGMVANDRATIFEVTTAGGIDVTKTVGIGAAGAALGNTTIPLDASVAQDVPSDGWFRTVDTSLAATGQEYRYEYSSVATTTVTLRAVAGGTLVAGGASTTVLVDTGQFTAGNFGTDGNPKVGMMVRDSVTNNWAVVLRRIDDNSLETTVISSGTWAVTNAYELNTVVVALVDADTGYFPYIDDTLKTGTELSKNIKFDVTTEIVARLRFSDPDIGGQRIQPFELLGRQITNADLTITAIRTDDTIAS